VGREDGFSKETIRSQQRLAGLSPKKGIEREKGLFLIGGRLIGEGPSWKMPIQRSDWGGERKKVERKQKGKRGWKKKGMGLAESRKKGKKKAKGKPSFRENRGKNISVGARRERLWSCREEKRSEDDSATSKGVPQMPKGRG